MARAGKMSEDELKALVATRVRTSVGYVGSVLSSARMKALDYYRGDKFGNEQEGRSQVVSRDVAEAIDAMMPALLKIFTSGDEVVRFEPQGPEDEQAAKQATDYINWIWNQQNPGFLIFHTWFKDALLDRNGIIKIWWEESKTSTQESYDGLTLTQIQGMMADNPDLEVKTLTPCEAPAEAPQPGAPPPEPCYDVVFTRTSDDSRVKIAPLPGDEFLIDRRAVSLEEVSFLAHRRRTTQSELVEMYPDKRSIIEDSSSDESNEYSQERLDRFKNEDEFPYRDDGGDSPSRPMWVTEAYVKVDFDGDGIAELRKVTLCSAGDTGGNLLDNEEIDNHPFADLTPIPMPHKFWGMSVADQVLDIQLIKSTLWRLALDSGYLSLSPRMGVVEGQVNLDDAMNVRAGGLIRLKDPTALVPVVTPDVSGSAFQMMAYADSVRESRTGVQRFATGPGADSINDAYTNTATGVNQVETASQERLECIARIFAETGVKKAFRRILELVCKHQDKPKMIKLRNTWVPMDPRAWSNRMDMSVHVGLGTGNKMQQVASLSNLLQVQEKIVQFQGGANGPLVKLENIYQTLSKLIQATGLKSVESYFSDPSQAPPAPPPQHPPDPKAMAEMERVKQEPIIAQMKAEIDSRTRVQVAHINAAAAIEAARVKALADNGAAAYAAEIAAQAGVVNTHLDNHAAMALQATAPQPEPTAPQ